MILYLIKSKQDPLKLYMFLYIFLLPWNFISGMVSNLTIIMFFWWLIIGKKKGYFLKLKDIFCNKTLVIFLFFIIYTLLSLFWSDNILSGFKELGFYKYYLIIILVFFSVFNKHDVKIAFYMLVFSLGLYAIFSLSIYLEIFSINTKDGISNKMNPRGYLPYSLVTLYMAISTFFSIYFFIKEKNSRLRYIFLFISIVSFFALLVNNGRISQLSFIVTLFILIIFYRKYLYQYKKLIVTIFLMIIVGISYLYNSNKLDRYYNGIKELQYSYEHNEYVGSWGARLFFWKAARENISKNLLFGTGVGDALDEFKRYQEQNIEILKHPIVKQYHNQHFELLAKFGVIGYSLFVISIYLLLKFLYREEKYFFYIGLVFFSMFFINSFGDSIIRIGSFNNIYILIFVLLALVLNKEKKI